MIQPVDSIDLSQDGAGIGTFAPGSVAGRSLCAGPAGREPGAYGFQLQRFHIVAVIVQRFFCIVSGPLRVFFPQIDLRQASIGGTATGRIQTGDIETVFGIRLMPERAADQAIDEVGRAVLRIDPQGIQCILQRFCITHVPII